MDRTWRALLGAMVVSLVVSACGSDTAATTTSTAPSTTSTTTNTTDTSPPTTSTSAPTTTTALAEEVGSLLVVGDWGSGTLPQGAVAGAMMRYAEDKDVAAILTTGDNFYSDDAEFLMEPYSWSEEIDIPWWITWGNHDIDSGQRIDALNQVFDDPPRWTVHRWSGIDVVVLDSTQPGSQEQIEFLTETLSGTDRPMIVVAHHPRYTCGSHQDDEGVHEDLLSHLDEDVFLVLSGHEHNYQRFEESGVTYVVTGGGGAALTEIGSCPPGHPTPVSAESAHHFLTLERDEGVTVSVIDVAGEPIDEFEVPLP